MTKKRGRPPLKPGKAKRANVTIRYREEVKAKLQKAAAENGRSLSEEIEHRLERSFIMDDVDQYLTRVFAELQTHRK